jgi:hypothetical protein
MQANGTGRWRIVKGVAAANPEVEVLQLQSDDGGPALLLLKVDENVLLEAVLLLVDREGELMVGKGLGIYASKSGIKK